jgi:hypothetical protein
MTDAIDLARSKLVRAMKHMGEVDAGVAEYASSQPYEIVFEANGKKYPRPTQQPPPDIGILVGELLYQVRSTLDHLFFELVKLNQRNVALPNDWERCCEPYAFDLVVYDLPTMILGYIVPTFQHLYSQP